MAALVVAAAGGGSAAARPVVPGCVGAVGGGANLPAADPSFAKLGGEPFGVAAIPGYAFVANTAGELDVLADRDSAPRLVHKIPLAAAGGDALGMTVTAERRYLLIADRDGAIVVDTARAQAGDRDAVLGTLDKGSGGGFGGAIEVAVSPDGRYAFVSLEDLAQIAVYRLAAAVADHFSKPEFVGAIPAGEAPVGLAVSPNGRWLYSTSELSGPGHRLLGRGRDGSLSVISVAEAEKDPAHAVKATVDAGCSPVRVAVSPSGRDVWVTARGSDSLLAFSAARLVADAKDALLASVRVGAAPVGVAVVDGGSRVVVADSDRFGAAGRNSALTVVDANAALAGRPALVGTVRAERFPRDVAVEPAGTILLVTNFGSGTLEAVHVADRAQESHG
ncbi:MAG TPA: YncE family protein [Solirubrobacteraceae bacterium]|nr:YncE family protein [Solirubrobacteraceae bacterium]